MTAATVMIVDDSLLIRAVVRAGLEAEGHQVMQAESGMAALEQCQIRPPDVILLDIIMPDLDGYQVLAKLKGDPKLSHIPVVFLTGRTDMSDVVAGLRAGAHDYLKKPFEPEELLARVGSAIHVKQLQDQLRERNAELDQVSRTDALTGLYNRRHLDEELIQRHSEARRYGEPLSLLLLDIDHFKRVNDTYGHPAGDIVLREFAAKLRTQLRVGDIAGRWGGEEFLIILPHTDLAGAATLAERIRAATAEAPITVATTPISVTVSGGCCAGPGGTPAELVDQADTQLYQAKAAGRNRIAVAEYRRPGDDVVTQSAANSARDIDRTAC